MLIEPIINTEPFGMPPNGEEIQFYTLGISGNIKASVKISHGLLSDQSKSLFKNNF